MQQLQHYFFLIMLSVIPAVSNGFFIPVIQKASGQGEDPFPVMGNETLTPSQQKAREQLLSQGGFSVKAITKNLSAPLNILYGPDNALWITERIGKDIVRIDPVNGSLLSSFLIPNVHQSAGQDGVLGMAFDPSFENNHHIYVAYTYNENPGGELDRKTKIT